MVIAQPFTPKNKMDRSLSSKTNPKSTMWKSMTGEGEFILLQVAVSFLTNDYEYCLRIADTDFSYVDISALFEGNILRYRSLASLKLFEHAKKDPLQDYA